MNPHADRYLARIDELASLKAELESPKRPGDPAPVVGRVLEAAGDLLRRTKAIPCDVAAVRSTLALVPSQGLASWGEVDPAATQTNEQLATMIRSLFST
jgi:hypothetical protein